MIIKIQTKILWFFWETIEMLNAEYYSESSVEKKVQKLRCKFPNRKFRWKYDLDK